MHDDSVLVAIDATLSSPSYCTCGRTMTIGAHDAALWLECPVLARPSRLPSIARVLRSLVHDRRFVVAVPDQGTGAAANPSSQAGTYRVQPTLSRA